MLLVGGRVVELCWGVARWPVVELRGGGVMGPFEWHATRNKDISSKQMMRIRPGFWKAKAKFILELPRNLGSSRDRRLRCSCACATTTTASIASSPLWSTRCVLGRIAGSARLSARPGLCRGRGMAFALSSLSWNHVRTWEAWLRRRWPQVAALRWDSASCGGAGWGSLGLPALHPSAWLSRGWRGLAEV
jgi:hypothetical protein